MLVVEEHPLEQIQGVHLELVHWRFQFEFFPIAKVIVAGDESQHESFSLIDFLTSFAWD